MTEPSELSRQITLMKGDRTTAEIIRGADVSRETYRKLERGLSVKLDTLMDIADFLKATDDQRTNLVMAWVKLEIGDHAQRIRISAANSKSPAALKDNPDEVQTILKQLPPHDRQQIILAMVRPEVRRAIYAINQLHDNLKARAPGEPAKPTKYKK